MIELKNDVNAVVYLIIYSPEKANSPTLKKHFARIENYLVEIHKIVKARVKVVSGGFGDGSYRTEVYIVPPGAVLPI